MITEQQWTKQEQRSRRTRTRKKNFFLEAPWKFGEFLWKSQKRRREQTKDFWSCTTKTWQKKSLKTSNFGKENFWRKRNAEIAKMVVFEFFGGWGGDPLSTPGEPVGHTTYMGCPNLCVLSLDKVYVWGWVDDQKKFFRACVRVVRPPTTYEWVPRRPHPNFWARGRVSIKG